MTNSRVSCMLNISESGSACELRKLQDATNVSVWSKICEMCRLYLYHICWGNISYLHKKGKHRF